MRLTLLCCAVSAVVAFSAAGLVAQGAETSPQDPQVIILKLDDVTANGAHQGSPVSPRWQRVADFIEQSHLQAAFGIIGYSLEEDNQAYFDWIKNLNKKGIIEFWNHGYKNRKGADKTGEFEGSFDEQKHSVERTQTLAQQKLGIELRAFGPHWSPTTNDTMKILEEFPEIKMWFYGDPKNTKKFVFERVLTLENPTFVPDFDKFKERYEKLAQEKKCLALQGHPNSWDDRRWEGFVKIVDYLKSKGCVFMTPSEYLKTASEHRGD